MRYRIIINQPGYLPENDPYEVDSIEEAIDALLEEIKYSNLLGKSTLADYDQTRKEIVSMPSAGISVEFEGYVHEAIPVG